MQIIVLANVGDIHNICQYCSNGAGNRVKQIIAFAVYKQKHQNYCNSLTYNVSDGNKFIIFEYGIDPVGTNGIKKYRRSLN